MHIELTDLLRCPNDHPEAFLVLLPGRMEGRLVSAGHLGCPICGWSTSWDDGVPCFGACPPPGEERPPVGALELLTLLGLEGPGGWLILDGPFGLLAANLTRVLPDVKLVAVNPPPDVQTGAAVSVIRSTAWPIKRHAARGAALGPNDRVDQLHASDSVLPGLRIVGMGRPPEFGNRAELLAATDQLWVARHS